MPAVAFDLRHPELVADELEQANRSLATERDVPDSILALLEDLAEQLSETGAADLEGIDPYLWIEVQQAALRALRAVHEDDSTSQRRAIRVTLEQLRFLLTRLAERAVVADERPLGELVRWFDQHVGGPQRRKAELLGVAERTYQRWLSQSEPTEPDAEDERVLRLASRIANQLRHSLGGPGVIDWFEQPRGELGDSRPADLLRAPDAAERLLPLAVATRSAAAA